jgi:hypothetical protein
MPNYVPNFVLSYVLSYVRNSANPPPASDTRALRIIAAGAGPRHSPARRWTMLGAMIALCAGCAPARGETFKCVDAAGKTSYQAAPCPAVPDVTLKVQAPGPVSAGTSSGQTLATPAAPAGSSGTVPSASRAPNRVPSEADFRGPRETWERLGAAIRRGDKDAALKELTPAAQRRLATSLDTIGSKSAPFNADELGSIRSVMLAREGLATITLTRTKADGTYLYQVNLIRDAEGKWRVDNM